MTYLAARQNAASFAVRAHSKDGWQITSGMPGFKTAGAHLTATTTAKAATDGTSAHVSNRCMAHDTTPRIAAKAAARALSDSARIA